MIRVFIVAAPTVRSGLRTFLESAGADIVGEADRLSDALGATADVIVLQSEDELARTGPAFETPVSSLLALSDDVNSPQRIAELSVHGWGVLPTSVTSRELRAGLAAVAQGLVVLPPAFARFSSSARAGFRDPETAEEPLTDREREILELAGRGLPNRAMAERLRISEHTVKFHLSTIYGKLGVSSRTEAVTLGFRRGLISL